MQLETQMGILKLTTRAMGSGADHEVRQVKMGETTGEQELSVGIVRSSCGSVYHAVVRW